MTIARTQAYALLQLDAIAEKLEKKANLGEIAEATKDAEPRSGNGSQSSHVASNFRTRSQCSNSTECSTPRPTNSTGTASG